ncbi:hypothetical protein F0L74_20470 [Chitinophaga agrisoli]|uniref:YD repeat-containing protein n=1 Tax=Chitinophaga agrisoli TaxID=2607653 RepID=A0A5B2VHJ5_9BACT|nr:hypothetical protein [Chitinophaga agrisoli]KAA2238601.1 hypothetical protein F0L74_20470 [Chitinophaga agrisoli]
MPYRSAKVVPPSPTAAALGQFGNIPVSYYNGSPNIAVPLYDIVTPNHSLKIALQYDASGTRVLQDASWVGLGWTLNAGGAITRVVRQQDDFIEHGYYNSQALPASTAGNSYLYNPATVQSDRQYFDNVYDGQMDGEPDMFNYNFGEFSGRFVIGKKAGGSVIFSDQKNNLEFIYSAGKWIATDAEGYKYYFGTLERTQDYNRSSSFELTSFDGVTGLNMDINSSPVTAWYLDSIVAPTAEKVSFTYVRGKSLSLVNQSEMLIKFGAIAVTGCSAQTPSGFSNDYHSYDASRQAIQDAYLQKITFQNGSVEFKISERTDVDYLDNDDGLVKPSKLDSIIIKNKSGARIKAYSFYYTYFLSLDQSTRLKLDSVAELGAGDIRKPPYAFNYINPNLIAPKYTKSIDHWGYYNGIVNYSLLPSTIFPLAPLSFTGADKSADTLSNYPMYGVLYEIIYPTGGHTDFEYELHDYSNLHGEQAYRTINKSAYVQSNSNHPSGDVITANFHLSSVGMIPPTDRIPVSIMCSYQKVDPNVTDVVSLGYTNVWKVEDNGTLNTVAGCTSANYDQPNPSPVFTDRMLDTGNYTMSILATRGYSFYMSISWQEKETVPLTYRKGGGIRIKRITDYDALGNQSVRRYAYVGDNGISSGVLLSQPKYDYSIDIGFSSPIVGTGVVIPCDYTARFYGVQSSSLFPSGLSSRSGIIGYSKVTEFAGENGENGRMEYYYNNAEEYTDGFPTIPSVGNPLNGKPTAVIVYNAQGDVLKRNGYTYSVNESTSLKGVKLMTAATVADAKYVYNMRFYDNVSSWVVPVTDTETVYSNSGKIATIKTSYYQNAVHRLPTREDVVRSDGSTLITKYKRPNDYTVSGNLSFVEKMRNSHLLSPVVEQEAFLLRDGATKLLSGTFTSYRQYASGFFKPDLIYKIEAAAPLSDLTESSFSSAGQPVLHPNYKPQVYFDAYSDAGNLLSYHEQNNINHAYFWGYSGQYPVASIEGADYNTAKQFITQNILDNPGSDAALRTELQKLRTGLTGAQVSTYTYSPLLGVTSQTDPKAQTSYFEYDGFGRLKLVKDKDGKILKQYDYQYQNPITQ